MSNDYDDEIKAVFLNLPSKDKAVAVQRIANYLVKQEGAKEYHPRLISFIDKYKTLDCEVKNDCAH